MAQDITRKKPPFRKLRGYAFDPSLSNKIDTAFINNIIYKVPWEDNLTEGPSGNYVEVIDFDPTVKKFYKPVNLNETISSHKTDLSPAKAIHNFTSKWYMR